MSPMASQLVIVAATSIINNKLNFLILSFTLINKKYGPQKKVQQKAFTSAEPELKHQDKNLPDY
jgi:hypothetical protein